ncbi:hypothetical protein EWH99_03220 [Sporolactobacillus sp. THM7-7]|nr:hypothetical protein EWH99_03220 [Sporolactobacillus sp. THM7-7]
MEKINTARIHKKHNTLHDRMKRCIRRIERLPADDLLEALAAIMYRMILFLGIPYFLFVLWSFIRMNS